jgi:hypothetical protein
MGTKVAPPVGVLLDRDGLADQFEAERGDECTGSEGYDPGENLGWDADPLCLGRYPVPARPAPAAVAMPCSMRPSMKIHAVSMKWACSGVSTS